jgi:antitoxin PrlF
MTNRKESAVATYDSVITSKGQITLPAEIRRAWKLEAGDSIEFYFDHLDGLNVRPRNAKATAFFERLPLRPRVADAMDDDEAIGLSAEKRDQPSRSQTDAA